MHRLNKVLPPLCFASLFLASSAFADAPPKKSDDVVQKLKHGEVNWSNGTITATGSGVANLKAGGPVAVARLGAERAATADAYRNLIETVKGIRVSGKKDAGDIFSSGTIKADVQGMVQGAQRVDTRYYDDGSVDVVIQMPLDDKLRSALSPKPAKKKVAVQTEGAAKYTGLVIDATGLGGVPSLAPKIVDKKGKVLYGKGAVDPASVAGGIAGYAAKLAEAKGHERAGDKPLVIKAVKLAKRGKTDFVISKEDAATLRDKNANFSFLKTGKVVIVLD